MAIAKVADRGSLAANTAGTSHLVDLAAGGSITVGNYLIARVAAENTGGGGAARDLTITDPRSNSWTLRPGLSGLNFDPGASGAGTTGWIAYCKVTSGYTNGDDITFGLSGSARLAVVVEEWSGIHGTTPLVGTDATATNTSSVAGALAAALSRTPTASGQLVYGGISVEGPNSDTYVEDLDSTAGSWVALTKLGTTNATATDNECVVGGYKLVTGTNVQSWSPTIGLSRDYAAQLLVFDVQGAATVNGTALAAFGALTATVSGLRTVGGTLLASFGTLSATVAGTRTTAGTAVSNLGGLSAAAAGAPVRFGTAASSFGGLTAAAAGVPSKPGTAVADLGGLSATVAGLRTVPGAALAAFGTLSATAAGSRATFGTAAASFGALSATAAGVRTVHGAALAAFGGLTATAAGTVTPGGGGSTVPGTALANFGGLTASVAGTRVVQAAGVATFGALSATVAGKRTVTATAVALFGPLTATIVGVRTTPGTATATLGPFTATVTIAGDLRDITAAPGPAHVDTAPAAATTDWAASTHVDLLTVGPASTSWQTGEATT